MRKLEMVELIAEKTGLRKTDVSITLEEYFKEIKTSLTKGEPVWVRGFGSFIIKKRRAKTGRNIRKGVAVQIPEYFLPVFNPAREFKEAAKTSKPKPKTPRLARADNK
jgi:DNA-binding protein HU-beta